MSWFFIQLASQDLASQRKGLVSLYWLLGSRHAKSDLSSFHLGRNAAASVAPYFSAYPVRTAAIHLCFEESSFRYVFNFGTMVIERTTRVRCKAHVGKLLPPSFHLIDFVEPCPLMCVFVFIVLLFLITTRSYLPTLA